MPEQIPYPVSGTVTKANGSVADGATVVLLNVELEETISTTTNSSGEYLLDLVNLTSDYAHSQYCYMIARYGSPTQYATATFIVDTAAGSKEQNFTLERVNTWAESQNLTLQVLLNRVYDPINNALRTTAI